MWMGLPIEPRWDWELKKTMVERAEVDYDDEARL